MVHMVWVPGADGTFKYLADQSSNNLLGHDAQLAVPQSVLQHIHDPIVLPGSRGQGPGCCLGCCLLRL